MDNIEFLDATSHLEDQIAREINCKLKDKDKEIEIEKSDPWG